MRCRRAAQQQHTDAQARLAGGQAQIDGAAPGVAGDAARTAAQDAEAAGAMHAAVARVQQANEAAATQIDGLVGLLAEMQGSDPDVLGDETGNQPRPAAPEDDGWSLSDIGHGILDVAGLVPVIGEPADGINAAWYGLEGDWTNAALSAGAMIPVAGVAFPVARPSSKVSTPPAAPSRCRREQRATEAQTAAPTQHLTRHGRPLVRMRLREDLALFIATLIRRATMFTLTTTITGASSSRLATIKRGDRKASPNQCGESL